MPTTETTFEMVQKIIHDRTNIELTKITRESTLVKNLGLDSFDRVELFMDLEEEFDVVIPDDDLDLLRSVGQIVDYIGEKVQ